MSDHKQPTVKPRAVWLGLVVALAGAVLVGLGVAFASWIWAIVGLVVLGAGAALAIRGGVIYDAHRVSAGQEIKEAIRGEEREGIKPGAMVEDPTVRQTSRNIDRHRLYEERRSMAAPRPPMANMGAILVAFVAVFLLFAQWGLYPTGYISQTNANWSLGFAMLVGAGAMRILLGQPGRHLPSTLFILASGVGMLLRAFLAAHEIVPTATVEAVCGVLLLIGGLLSLASPATRLEQLPTQRREHRAGQPQAH